MFWRPRWSPAAGLVPMARLARWVIGDMVKKFQGNKKMYCDFKTCKTERTHVKCPKCDGVIPIATQCSSCNSTGYKCSKDPANEHHK